jgi:uncharacterized membrane protein YczE
MTSLNESRPGLPLSIIGLLSKYLLFMMSLFVISFGIMLTVEARLGVDAWSVLHQGLAIVFPITFGQAAQVVGGAMIGLGLLLKKRPTIGTLLNMYFVGLFCDVIADIGLIPPIYENTWLAILYFAAGTILSAFGCACYISVGIGAGPRDTCMLALSELTHIRVGIVRAVMEVSALIIGWYLGGNAGPGTLAGALTFGFIMEAGFKIIKKIGLLFQGKKLTGSTGLP